MVTAGVAAPSAAAARCRRRVSPAALAVAAALSLSPACAQRLGEKAALGMSNGLKKAAAEQDPSHRPVQVAAERAVIGAVEALDSPEQRAHLRRVVSEAVSTAVESALRSATERSRTAAAGAGATAGGGANAASSPIALLAAQAAGSAADSAVRRVVAELGTAGDGPLALSLSRTGEQIAASAVGGATERLGALLPGCPPGQEQACLEQRLHELARSTGAGLSAGVRKNLGWPFLIAAFAVGALAGVVGAWVVSLRSLGRRALRARTT